MSSLNSQFKHCIFFLLDGFRPDVLKELVDRNQLPHLKELFFDRGTFWTGTTVFPSTTGPAYLPVVTGCYPGTCNVPGIRWVDRAHFKNGNWNKKGTRSYVGYESFYFNHDISPKAKTAFEIFDDHLSINNMVNRGVKKENEPSKLYASLMILVAKLTHKWDMVDELASKLTEKHFETKSPKYSFISFLGVDEAAHLSTPFSDKTYVSYKQIDRSIGKIVALLKKKGIYDETIIFASADHGLSATRKHFELCDFVSDLGYKTFVYPKVYQRNNTAAVMVSGNSMANVYFRRSGNWKEQMYFEDLTNRNLITPFLEQEAIDILISRSQKGSVIVSSRQGRAEISNKAGVLHYERLNGDPFGFEGNLDPVNNYFDATIHSNYPDAIMQSYQIMNASRAGDLIVTSAIGFDLRNRFEIPEHFSSHGSLHKEHMLVPILCNQKLESDLPKRTINIFPTILKAMGVDTKNLHLDGQSFI